MPKKFKKDVFDLSKGYIGLGIGSAVGAGVQAHAPPGTPSMTGGFAAAASLTPTIGISVMGGSALRIVKGYSKTKKTRKRRRR